MNIKPTLENISNSISAWQELSQLPKNPRQSLKIVLYFNEHISKHADAALKMHMEILKNNGASEEKGILSLDEGHKNFQKTQDEYSELMATEIEMPCVEMTIKELILAIPPTRPSTRPGAQPGEREPCVISDNCIATLMKFFKPEGKSGPAPKRTPAKKKVAKKKAAAKKKSRKRK